MFIYFYPAHDHGTHLLQEEWHGEKFLAYTYRVIRIWELSPQEIVENGWVGLYPLLPLMRRNMPRKIRKEALQFGVDAIMKVTDIALRRDLLAVMGVLAGEIYPKEWIHSMIRREMIMESPIYQDWMRDFHPLPETREGRSQRIGLFLTFRLFLMVLRLHPRN
ncbi:conserved hypothetical protein [[Clostridium] ultunense Esp]|nr:conserved hypothetical protein [[Clostridium] ultunense Esp]